MISWFKSKKNQQHDLCVNKDIYQKDMVRIESRLKHIEDYLGYLGDKVTSIDPDRALSLHLSTSNKK